MGDYPDYTGTIDILAQEIGIFIGAEWAVKQGNDKFLFVVGSNKPDTEFEYIEYPVPKGKTFYINYFSFAIYATTLTDKEKPQIGSAGIRNQTDSLNLARIGGNGGGGGSFPSPVKIPAEKVVRLTVYNQSGHTVNVFGALGGYVI